MLDYEGIKYQVIYKPNNGKWNIHRKFDTEEDAIEFIKANRENWQSYKMIQQIYAIIDF